MEHQRKLFRAIEKEVAEKRAELNELQAQVQQVRVSASAAAQSAGARDELARVSSEVADARAKKEFLEQVSGTFFFLDGSILVLLAALLKPLSAHSSCTGMRSKSECAQSLDPFRGRFHSTNSLSNAEKRTKASLRRR